MIRALTVWLCVVALFVLCSGGRNAERMIAASVPSFAAADDARRAPEAGAWFADSFEGDPPRGWSTKWRSWGANITTDEGGTPPDGGKFSYRQIWHEGKGWSGLNLRFGGVEGMPAKLGDGSEFYMRYFLKYDPDFDFGRTTGFKQIIVQSDSIVHDRMYIVLKGKGGRVVVHFQIAGGGNMPSNVNGPALDMPKGRWVEFEWYVKVSPQSAKKGVLKCWVDGQLRWDYSDIATIKEGSYVSLSINPTFNQTVQGPKQKRYWDLFSISPARMGKDRKGKGARPASSPRNPAPRN